MTVPSREEQLLHYPEAAALVGVSVDVVKQWKSRHNLEPAGWDRWRPLFHPDAVRAADLRARTCPAGRPRKDHPRTVSAAEDWDTARLARSTKELPEDFWEQLATVDDAAALAGVTPSTVHNWITRGYVDRHGQRRWLLGFHVQGVRRVLPLDVLRADAEVGHAGRGGLRKRAM